MPNDNGLIGPLPNITDDTVWFNLNDTETGAYCEYHNDASNVSTHGRLYNWYAVDDSRGLAPEGWHVPSYGEWQILVNYLGGSCVAGGKMKDARTEYWASPNTVATNENGFTALPGGYRVFDGWFRCLTTTAYFWSSAPSDTRTASYQALLYDHADVFSTNIMKRFGYSVRCVRDD